jgi:hypothetical protein
MHLREKLFGKLKGNTLPLAGCLVAAVYMALHPSFRFRSLFNHQLIPIESPYSFPSSPRAVGWTGLSSDGPQAQMTVKQTAQFRSRNAYQGPWGGDGAPAIGLDGQQAGILEVKLPFPPDGYVTLRADIHAPADGRARVVLNVPAAASRDLVRTGHLRQGYFRLDPWIAPQKDYVITVEASRGPVLIERLGIFQAPKAQAPPPLDRMILVVCFIGFLLRSLSWPKHRTAVFLSVGVPLILAAWGQLTERGIWASSWVWFAGVVGVVLFRAYKPPRSYSVRPGEWVEVLLLLALVLRWSSLMACSMEPLEGDPLVYCTWASHLSWKNVLVTGTREPFYVWLQFLGMQVLGPNAFQARVVSLALSMTTVYLTYRLAWELSGRRIIGGGAALALSFNTFAVFASSSAERTQGFEPLVAAFCWLMIATQSWTFKRAAAAACLAAALSLNWLIGIVQVGTFLCAWAAARRISLLKAFSIVGLTAFLLMPYFIASWKVNGSPLAALNIHASYYQRLEKEGVHAYGPKTTWSQFFLKDLGIGRLLAKTGSEYASLLLNPANRYNRVFLSGDYWNRWSYWLFPFFLIGFLTDLFRRRFIPLLILVSFLNIAPYFSQAILGPRYVFYIAPVFAYWIASGFFLAFERLRPLLKKIPRRRGFFPSPS